MRQDELIKAISQHFTPQELVSRRVYEKYGAAVWKFFDPRLLETIIVLRRDILKVPLVCNNWKSGGSLSQRGLRENTCEIVRKKSDADALYLSAHTLGMAVDLSSGKMSADEMRRLIVANAAKLPHPVRIEHGDSAPTWLHIDVMTEPTQKEKVYVFV